MSDGPLLDEIKDKEYESLPDLCSPGEHDYIYCKLPFGAPLSKTSSMYKKSAEKFVVFPWIKENGNVLIEHLKNISEMNHKPFEQIMKLVTNLTKRENMTLNRFYESLPTKEEKEKLKCLICKLAGLAAEGPGLFPEPIRYLTSDLRSSSATLSQKQCACLMAHCFLCTFEDRREGFNIFTMSPLFNLYSNHIAVLKWKFFFNYFEQFFETEPKGCVSFRRSEVTAPDWSNCTEKFNRLQVTPKTIEQCKNCSVVDFADRFIGGIVLQCGLLQEEILFLHYPEMIVSQLLIPMMLKDEAVFIVGAQRYNGSQGYDHTTKWAKLEENQPKRDRFGRFEHEVIAVDAFEFGRFASVNEQFEKKYVDRELNKLYAGFSSSIVGEKRPIATGNWGCGAFMGNVKLKTLLQLIAASKAGRDLVYCPFGNKQLDNLTMLHTVLEEKKVSIGEVYNLVVRGKDYRGDVFQDVLKALLDK